MNLKTNRSIIVLFVCFLGLFIFLTSCKQKAVFNSKSEMINYLKDPDNNHLWGKKVKGIAFELQHRPTDLMVALENPNPTKGQMDSLRSKYQKSVYFTLSISTQNKDLLSQVALDKKRFSGLVQDLAFGMSDKATLYSSDFDTIKFIGSDFSRLYGMGKSNTVLMAFEKDPNALKSPYLFFSIKDLGLSLGDVRFKIPTESLINQPEIAF